MVEKRGQGEKKERVRGRKGSNKESSSRKSSLADQNIQNRWTINNMSP